jgi:hypothetical protein
MPLTTGVRFFRAVPLRLPLIFFFAEKIPSERNHEGAGDARERRRPPAAIPGR